MYCTQCTSRQVLLMCTQRLGWKFVRPGRTHTHGCLHSHATCLTPHTQRLGWGFVRPGRTHTHGCLRSHATYLTPHTGMLCLGVGCMRACVISINIVVNPQWYELTCIAHSAQVVKCC